MFISVAKDCPEDRGRINLTNRRLRRLLKGRSGELRFISGGGSWDFSGEYVRARGCSNGFPNERFDNLGVRAAWPQDSNL